MATNSPDNVAPMSSELVFQSYDLEYYTLSILIIGASGTGKSMFCNFLAHTKDCFTEACGVESVTERVEHCVKEIADDRVLIVDSPGFCDPIKSDEELIKEISETAILTRDGVDVVAIVVDPTKRFSTVEKNALIAIDNLGGSMWKHAFIIFNNAARIEKKFRKKAEDYIEYIRDSPKTPKELKEMIELASGRYICVESVDLWNDENYWQDKSKEVVEIIRTLKNKNIGKRYKNSIMSMGTEAYDIIQKLKTENKETKDQIEKLNEELTSQKRKEEQTKDHVENQENRIKELEDKLAYFIENGHKKNEESAKNDMEKLVIRMMERFDDMNANKRTQEMQAAQMQAKTMQEMQAAQMQAKTMQEMQAAQMQAAQMHAKQMEEMQAAQMQRMQAAVQVPRSTTPPEPKPKEGSSCCVM